MEEQELSLEDILRKLLRLLSFIKKRFLYIVLIGIVGGCLGIVNAYFSKPKYIAKLTFALEIKSQSSSGSLGSIASQFGFNLGGSDAGAFSGDNIMELMKSKNLVEKTLLTTSAKGDLLIDKYIKANELDKAWTEKPNLAKMKFSDQRELFTRDMDSIMNLISTDIIKNMLDVSKVDKKLSIISVKITSRNEEFSKEFCENLIKIVTDFYVETKTSKSKSNVNILQSRVDSVKTELDNALVGRAVFSDRNMSLIRQSAGVPKVKQEMKVQMLSAMYTELVKNLEFSKLALMREEPLIQIIDYPIYPLDKVKKSKSVNAIGWGILSVVLYFIYLIILMIRNKIKSFSNIN